MQSASARAAPNSVPCVVNQMLIVLAPEHQPNPRGFTFAFNPRVPKVPSPSPRPTKSSNPSIKLSPTLHAGHALPLAFPLIAKPIGADIAHNQRAAVQRLEHAAVLAMAGAVFADIVSVIGLGFSFCLHRLHTSAGLGFLQTRHHRISMLLMLVIPVGLGAGHDHALRGSEPCGRRSRPGGALKPGGSRRTSRSCRSPSLSQIAGTLTTLSSPRV
jgi:hypothetical protein